MAQVTRLGAWVLFAALVLVIGCRKTPAREVDASTFLPAKTFVAETLLFEVRIPENWTTEGTAEHVSLMQVVNGSSSMAASVERSVQRTLAEVVASYHSASKPLEERTVDGRPAALAQSGGEGDGDLFFFVENKRGYLLTFTFRISTRAGAALSRKDVNTLIGTLHFLEPKPGTLPVPPGARFEVSGTVEVREGSCMPPSPPCTTRPVSRKLVVTTMERFGRTGTRVATATSGADGRYRVSAPVGSHVIRVLAEDDTDGTHFETSNTVTVFDRAVTADIVINHAED